MNLFRSFLARRQFLFAFIGSTMALVSGGADKMLNFIFKEGVAGASERSEDLAGKSIKGIVVYYSATGSTGKVAKAIYEGMKSVIDCDVAPVKKIRPEDMSRYDVMAIGGPIWYSRDTANIELFIHNMPHMAGKLCALFCTHGTGPNGFFYSISRNLLKRALTIIGWQNWYGSCSHVINMPRPYPTDGHPDEIDLMEARAFGKEMAERAKGIYAGEKGLIPKLPSGPNADSLWIQQRMEEMGSGGGDMPGPESDTGGDFPGGPDAEKGGDNKGGPDGGPSGGEGMPMIIITDFPEIDLSRCVYPRCNACMDLCIQGAIDLSKMTSSAATISGSSLLVKNACIHCGYPLCQAVCIHDAIIYKGRKTNHEIDTDKCIYPKCTLCADHCPMNSIDLSHNPPIFHNNCEGCNLCWCLCPEDAIDIPNLIETHGEGPGMTRENHGFLNILQAAEANGKFRSLVTFDEIGWDNILNMDTKAPRVVLNEDDYPCHME